MLSSSFTSGSFPSMPHSLHEDLFTGGVRVATRSSTSSNWKQQVTKHINPCPAMPVYILFQADFKPDNMSLSLII